MLSLTKYFVATILLLTILAPQSQAALPLTKIAVIVGANEAVPGRKKLRFSHRDAKATAQVLQRLAGFRTENLHVLIDPHPDEVLQVLDQSLLQAKSSSEALLFFYYSGHADAHALYPKGKPLKLEELRRRLDHPAATVRIGMIDACRGGGWTGTKGLNETKVFEVQSPISLSNRGSILISSSSGLENAHESEQLKGSFFTHHWNAALKGAADRNGDGTVTLNEAFDYAKVFTIRDTALQTKDPQHPSFHLNLSGRQDLPLSQLHSVKTLINVAQRSGPLELIHLETGLIILEVPHGERRLQLAVSPGRYLLRKKIGEKTWAKEIVVAANAITNVQEGQLDLLGQRLWAAKDSRPRPVTLGTIPKGMWEIQAALGVQHLSRSSGVNFSGGDGKSSDVAGALQVVYGITDRWQWVIPTVAAAYRFGDISGFEWILSGGLLGWSLGYSSIEGTVLSGVVGATIDGRWNLSTRSSLNATAAFWSDFRWHSEKGCAPGDAAACKEEDSRHAPDSWRTEVNFGYSHTLFETVTMTFGVGVQQNLLYRGKLPDVGASSKDYNLGLNFGSIQARGLRKLPLVRIHLSDVFSLDADVSFIYLFSEEKFSETYMAGATWIW
jgi:hypothetical protein